MLKYLPCGPSEDGFYLICYRIPGSEHILSVIGSARTLNSAQEQCERLNSGEMSERRKALREKIVSFGKDL